MQGAPGCAVKQNDADRLHPAQSWPWSKGEEERTAAGERWDVAAQRSPRGHGSRPASGRGSAAGRLTPLASPLPKKLAGSFGVQGNDGEGGKKKKNLKNYKLSQLRSLILPALSLPFLGWIRNPARAPRDASSSLSPSCYIIPLGLFCIHVGVTSPSAQTQP